MIRLKDILLLLPDKQYSLSLFSDKNSDSDSQRTACSYCLEVLNNKDKPHSSTVETKPSLNRALILAGALKDKLYEILNTGHWSKVNTIQRQAFTLATFLNVTFKLLQSEDADTIEQCMFDLDQGLLLGCTLDEPHGNLLQKTIELMQPNISINFDGPLNKKRKIIEPSTSRESYTQTIPIIDKPSVEHFRQNYFLKHQPVLLTNCIQHWPAMDKWPNPDYLISIAGQRTVPIEIGQNYTSTEWSQDLVKFKDFFTRQIMSEEICHRIEYLAQHNLFDQIPALRTDIIIPEYCCLSETLDNDRSDCDVDIKCWLGPSGTVSPMHQDPKHNLLCQVFGRKKVILAAPDDEPNLYPHSNRMLQNTSQIDAENVDFEQFPLSKNVKFLYVEIGPGDMLFIPIKWWHYVRSLEKSFSVSFWWT